MQKMILRRLQVLTSIYSSLQSKLYLFKSCFRKYKPQLLAELPPAYDAKLKPKKVVRNLTKYDFISGRVNFVNFLCHKAFDVVNRENIKDIYQTEPGEF